MISIQDFKNGIRNLEDEISKLKDNPPALLVAQSALNLAEKTAKQTEHISRHSGRPYTTIIYGDNHAYAFENGNLIIYKLKDEHGNPWVPVWSAK